MPKKRNDIGPYKSKFEQDTARTLEKKGVGFSYETLALPYTLVLKRKYYPDFMLDNGIIVETKGKFTSDDRRKHLQIKKEHPQLDIRLVFQRDNRLTRKSNTRYSDWCIKNGFKFAIGSIPHDWTKER